MGRRAAEEAENHWPGFVDALSTIVMVVTFLLIILAIVIFVLSQQTAKTYLETLAEQTQQGGGDMQSAEAHSANKDFRADQIVVAEPIDDGVAASAKVEETTPTPQTPSQQASQESQTSETSSSSSSASTTETKDQFKAELADERKAEEELEDGEDLKILSQPSEISQKKIAIAPLDKTEETPKVEVKKAQTVLVFEFPDTGVKIDENAVQEVKDFANENAEALKDKRITIWSFTNAKDTSISQAKRIAYYRALAARNELLSNGIPADKIGMEIRFLGEEEEANNSVRVVVN